MSLSQRIGATWRPKREHLWQTLRIIGACALAYLGAVLIGLPEIYWSLITAVVVTQPGLSDTLAAGRDRIVATLAGAILGFVVLEISALGAPKLPLFWAALAPLALLTAIKPNLRLASATLIVIVIVPSYGGVMVRPLDRVIEILVGVVASIVASAALDPARLWRR
ncbi:MAG TPA: FUSC family protein [Roseiarcus sp.]|nr:FUSC family protein [Roseiarcus sp.]